MAGNGPLPKPNARRRNAPTIPTTSLPAGGRKDPAPDVPEAYNLQEAGVQWWAWAWALPQAAAWDDGALYVIARRAQLEDDLAALEYVDGVDVADMLSIDEESAENLKYALGRLKATSSGRSTVMREMRELDDRLGLSPKGMAALRWTIVKDEVEAPAERPTAPRRDRGHLRAVDPALAS